MVVVVVAVAVGVGVGVNTWMLFHTTMHVPAAV